MPVRLLQQADVPTCTNCTVQLIKCCSWWWTNGSPKHVEPFNEKIKTIHKNLCISLIYIHIAIWCTVHTMSNSKPTLLVYYTAFRGALKTIKYFILHAHHLAFHYDRPSAATNFNSFSLIIQQKLNLWINNWYVELKQ